jgi:hypothetical protein
VPVLTAVIDGTGLFPSELLDDMLADSPTGEVGDELWLTADGVGKGAGPVAVAYAAPERMLLARTSGVPAIARTRALYRREGYADEPRVRAFYAAGEDQVVLWKALDSAAP